MTPASTTVDARPVEGLAARSAWSGLPRGLTIFLTAVAVLQLVDAGKVRLDDPVTRYVTLRPHLAAGAEVDPRLKDVTVRHCLNHTGGWDRDRSGDPIGIPARIAAALGGTPPVSAADVVRYTLGLRLDFDPGARYAY